MQEIVNNEESKFSDDSSQSYDCDMSPENINSPTSSDSEEGDCCNDEETESDIQHGTWIKAGRKRPYFLFIE